MAGQEVGPNDYAAREVELAEIEPTTSWVRLAWSLFGTVSLGLLR